MQRIRILELIHQDVTESLLIVRTQRFILLQQFVGAQQEFGKIHRAFALTLRFVLSVNLYFAAGVGIVRFGLPGTDALLFQGIDVMHHVARRKTLFIHPHRFDQTLDRCLLITGIENLKCFRQACSAPVRAQKTMTQTVESPDP